MPPTWTKLIAAADIAAAVAAAGAQIARDYGGEELVLIGMLQGGLFFLADLARALPCPLRVDTMLAQSYGGGLTSSGVITLRQEIHVDIADRHVLVVDDIYDSGRTLRFALDHLGRQKPRSLAVACLLVKDAPRAATVAVRYGLFAIPNVFVVGCGLDLAGQGRQLRDVWALAPGISEQAAGDELRAQLRGGFEPN